MWSGDNSSTHGLCRRGFDERTMRCRRRKKHPGSSHLNSITLPIPSDSVPVNFYNAVSWYSVTLSETGTLQADTESTLTNIDTKIAIYNNEGGLVTFNDDCGNEPNPYLSNVSATGLLAGSYYIVVGFTGTTFSENFTITTNNIQPQNGVLLSVTFTPTPVPILGLFNTGQGLSDGDIDMNYTLTFASHTRGLPIPRPMNRIPYAVEEHPIYDNSPDCGWIGFVGDFNDSHYRVQTTFDLTGYDVNTVTMSLELAVDNILNAVYLNGENTGIIPYNAPRGFGTYPITTGFQSGINTIEIDYGNGYGDCGIRVRLSGTAFRLVEALTV